MGVKIRIRRGVIHLVIHSGGRRYEESTGLHVSPVKAQNDEIMKFAELLRSRKELQIIQGMNGIEMEESRLTLYEYTERYSASRGRDSMIYKALPYIERFGGRNIKISAITSRWFENFQEQMKKDSGLKSAHTQEKYCCIVRQVLKKAVRDGILRSDPAGGIKHISVPDSIKEFLTAEEIQKMASTEYFKKGSMSVDLQNEIRTAFLFGCYTGFRISDLVRLKWGDISFERMEITKIQKKTRRKVVVPVRKDILQIINPEWEEKAPDGFIFPLLGETHTTTNRYLQGWAKASGIQKNVTWHTARHTDATLLIESGAELYTVMRLLGHTKIQTTMQYAVVSDRKKREAVENLPRLGWELK